jgi:hypothetical protein
MFRGACISLFLLGLSSTVSQAANMSDWERAVTARCPTHHLKWTCDGCWDDFLADFEQTLPQATQGDILKIADYSRRCAKEVAGFSCEMSVHVDAMHRLGLLRRFVTWGCQHYSCEEAAICTRTPAAARLSR